MKMFMIIVTRNDDHLNKLLNNLRDYELKGTVIPTTSIRHAILDNNIEPLPVFGGLRQLYSKNTDLNTTIMLAVEQEELENVKQAVRDVYQDVGQHKALMLATPLSYFEELTD
ncbi:MAG: hypothetical protein PHW00_05525 [Clostridia bacterium]|nr:hypothetical protein [Clostridia bacterium]MDD3832095.1 hypothetical protein [Clostridia bacterium]